MSRIKRGRCVTHQVELGNSVRHSVRHSSAWVKQAERDAGTGDGGLTSDERQELSELRRENRRLREDVDILKRATAFFAKETR